MPRLSISKVPELLHQYPGWRAEVEGEILACGIGRKAARRFLDEMNTLDSDQLKEIPEDDMFANTDAVLWAKVIGAMK